MKYQIMVISKLNKEKLEFSKYFNNLFKVNKSKMHVLYKIYVLKMYLSEFVQNIKVTQTTRKIS